MASSSLTQPIEKFEYQNKIIYHLGNHLMIYVDQYLDYQPKIHLRKFIPKTFGKGYYPSTEGLTINPTNLEFLLDMIHEKLRPNLICVKDLLHRDYEKIIEKNEKMNKRKRSETDNHDREEEEEKEGNDKKNNK